MENKKVEDCHFFVSGHCNKGDSCEFRHNPEVRGQPICINWLLEQCSDPDCPNRHPTLPRTPQRTRTLCFYNQACTRPDCLFLHTGTIASPATPRPDQETQLTVTLTPRNASAKGTSSPVASTSPVIKPAAPAQVPAPSGPLRPVRNRTAVLPTLPPREQSSASAGASTASFVKSFDEIMKDKEHGTKSAEPSKQPPTAKPREEPQQRKADNKQARTRPLLAEMSVPRAAKGGKHSTSATPTAESSRQERAKGNGIRSRPASSGTSTTASSSSSTAPSFGVKTLEELLQEKNNSKPASASAAGAPSRPGGAGGVKRGREESAATTRALSQPQQKQPRADLAAKPTAPPQPVEEEDDLEKELAEIGVDDINSMAGEVIDDDELNELLEE